MLIQNNAENTSLQKYNKADDRSDKVVENFFQKNSGSKNMHKKTSPLFWCT